MGPLESVPGPIAFLDANIMFSAALGGKSFELLWDLSKKGLVKLVTTQSCAEEAKRNVARKRPESLDELTKKMRSVGTVPGAGRRLEIASEALPASDAAVFAAAVASAADVLITGDIRHFGPWMNRQDLPVRVMTLRSFLIEGLRR